MLEVTRKDGKKAEVSWKNETLFTVTHRTWKQFQSVNGQIDLSTEDALDKLATAIANDTKAFTLLALDIRREAMSKKPKSRIIKDVSYDANTKVMTITFTTGVAYTYQNVPQRVVNDFTTADSQGMFFHSHIRDRYETAKVEQD